MERFAAKESGALGKEGGKKLTAEAEKAGATKGAAKLGESGFEGGGKKAVTLGADGNPIKKKLVIDGNDFQGMKLDDQVAAIRAGKLPAGNVVDNATYKALKKEDPALVANLTKGTPISTVAKEGAEVADDAAKKVVTVGADGNPIKKKLVIDGNDFQGMKLDDQVAAIRAGKLPAGNVVDDATYRALKKEDPALVANLTKGTPITTAAEEAAETAAKKAAATFDGNAVKLKNTLDPQDFGKLEPEVALKELKAGRVPAGNLVSAETMTALKAQDKALVKQAGLKVGTADELKQASLDLAKAQKEGKLSKGAATAIAGGTAVAGFVAGSSLTGGSSPQEASYPAQAAGVDPSMAALNQYGYIPG